MTNRIAPPMWHDWALHPNIPALIFTGQRHPGYRIDLDRMLTRDQFGWWVLQIYDKWGSEGLAGFVSAADDILDFQKTAEFTPESIRRQVARFVEEW